ncbi:RND transporter [Pseudoxanthomonas koreensis]|nr:RND transporter [Pseudoxanthomonas koreensis]
MPVVRSIEDFDHHSGHFFERAIFNHRRWIVFACLLLTLLLGFQATKLTINAGFEKMIPHGHEYVKNYLENRGSLRGLGNSVRVVVENVDGDIFDPEYLEVLKQVNDELFLMRDVDRAWMKSIWTPAVRWSEVNEEGFVGGPVMPDNYDGSPASVDALKLNIRRANIVGNLVANDFRSSMVFVPLLETNPDTGQRLDYHAFSQELEQRIRARYEDGSDGKTKIHVIGFAKLVGDLIEGLVKVASFFLAAAVIAGLIIFLYTRCVRSTLLVVACSVIAVSWQLGLVQLFGFELDPFSVLVPFLIFAIGVSHGAQKMNGIMQDIGRGTHRLVAARYTFRRLFLAGLTALLADVVGFAVLMVIDIPVIKELALTASIGVGVLVFTNLILLPVLLSYTGVSPAAAARSLREDTEQARGRGLGAVWNLLVRFTERRWALGAIGCAVVLAAGGLWVSRGLQIGDLDPGAPELRKDSRYNRDNAYITTNYALSSDLFAVIVQTPDDACLNYKTLVQADRLGWALQQDPSVQTTVSLADAVRNITAGSFEGNPKWLTLNRNQGVINYSGQQATVLNPDLFNTECSVLPVIAYLSDHKAASLKRVAAIAEDFAAKHNDADVTFKLAAGSAGIEAATNEVVGRASRLMLLYVYGAVGLLCFVAFRSWRAVVVAVLPLMLTSILCEALMVGLGIGVKVATLPVIALGAGIGVDYALYLLSVQLAQQRAGAPLAAAYRHAVMFTGKVVALVGVTLAAGVVTWTFSPIKFQADMGILLTFMFLWNMIGALVLIPALSHFLLRKVEV